MTAQPSRAPRRQARSTETVAYIIEASERLRRAEGTPGITHKRVAEVAGVGIGTVYHHFPDRQALLRETERRAWAAELADLLAQVQRIEAGSPVAMARAFVDAAIACALRRIDAHGLTMDDPDLRSLMFEFFDQVAAHASAMIRALGVPLRVADLSRSLTMATEVVAMMTWVAAHRHRDELASGAFQRELADLLCRYLLSD